MQETGLVRDLVERQIGRREQVLDPFDACTQQVLVRRAAQALLEFPLQERPGDRDGAQHFGNPDRVLHVLAHEPHRGGNPRIGHRHHVRGLPRMRRQSARSGVYTPRNLLPLHHPGQQARRLVAGAAGIRNDARQRRVAQSFIIVHAHDGHVVRHAQSRQPARLEDP